MAITLLFQGDSVTDAGRDRETREANTGLGNGYVSFIAEALKAREDLMIYNRGVSGNRIGDMYARWIEDTLNLKPDILSVLNGINDVGFGLRLGMGSDARRFEKIYDMCLAEARAENPDLKIILIEPFILRVRHARADFGDDIYANFDEWYENVRERAAVVRRLAEKYGAIFVPLQERMNTEAERVGAAALSRDCIHPTADGCRIIAEEFLKATKDLAL